MYNVHNVLQMCAKNWLSHLHMFNYSIVVTHNLIRVHILNITLNFFASHYTFPMNENISE